MRERTSAIYKVIAGIEINEMSDSDAVVWLGIKTYDMYLHIKYLGAEQIGDKRYFRINDKEIPILGMWHTVFY